MMDRSTTRRRDREAARRARTERKRRIRRSRALAVASVVGMIGCGEVRGDTTNAAGNTVLCEVETKAMGMDDPLRETSGLAESRKEPGVYWTHNDSGRQPDIFAVTAEGRSVGQARVTGARNRDWEDIASGRCPDGGDACLYLADTGNNDNDRKEVSLWVVPEPATTVPSTAPATEYRARFPGEPTDIEAIALLPDGRIYLVSKGSKGPVTLFRWPTPLRQGHEATLEQVRALAPHPEQVGDRVTAASATPDGKWVAVRTYAALAFYRTADLLGGGLPYAQFDLDPIAEPQGEGVALANDGNVVLSSEGPEQGLPGTISHMRCILPQ
ncbi:MAG TPA: hypothetical protein VFS20_29945 [Longimicrobium sp.]|nr:hypothetical protein [Longimicrobium sp.]